MDASASPTYGDLQRRVRELEERNAAHVAREQSLIADQEALSHIATEAVRALSLQRPYLQPEGFWILGRHREWLSSIVELSARARDAENRTGGGWHWQKIIELEKDGVAPPDPRALVFSARQLEHSVLDKPFRQSFPLEVFEAIIANADAETISRVTQASFSCYQLFMPVLLQHNQLWRTTDLKGLLGVVDLSLPKSPRLDPSRRFTLIRTISILSSTLQSFNCAFDWKGRHKWSLDLTRLPPGTSKLHIEVLTIGLDAYRRNDGRTTLLDPDSVLFLACLDPVVFAVGIAPGRYDEEGVFHIISRPAAIAMCEWTRLREIYLDDAINLVTHPAGDPDARPADCTFFLAPRGGDPGGFPQTPALIEWDLSDYGSLPSWNHRNLLDLLLHRDDLLRQGWVRSFTVIVYDDERSREGVPETH